MSRFDVDNPECKDGSKEELFEQIIIPRVGDIGNFEVKRALPTRSRQMVGPFIFFDQMGPGEFISGQGVDVRPHPHIGLSTLTYLFDGSLDHKDSLGMTQRITPGEVNLMTAGSGIVHSERTGEEIREKPSRLFGLQTWLALPKDKEEIDCSFDNYAKALLPILEDEGKKLRVIAGQAYGLNSPVYFPTQTLYIDVELEDGAVLPLDAGLAPERAIYALSGGLEISGQQFPAGQMLLCRSGDSLSIKARGKTRMVILGGEPADGPRHMFWNFVSSSKQRIEQAKEDWREGRFGKVAGDEDFIPLPQD